MGGKSTARTAFTKKLYRKNYKGVHPCEGYRNLRKGVQANQV
jgi:hypothetical protein